jgi:hypothetical protein
VVAAATAGWAEVEALLVRLAGSGESFSTTTSKTNRISRYEAGRRVRVETDRDSLWVNVEDIRGCWGTFERLGRIKRADVLDPGRNSAFMMALFQQVEGIRQEQEDELYLVLRPSRG